MWTPLRADSLDLLWRRSLSHAVCLADGILNPEVQFRKYVGSAKAEHEEHLGGPAADAFT
jgi:hypothetical protein